MSILIRYLLTIPAIVVTVGVHEYTKAVISAKLGDPIPVREGRCTINLFKHVDFLGLICMMFTGLGWGNPVNTSALHYKNRKNDTIIVYTIPSIVNVMLAFIFQFLLIIISRNITITGGMFDTILMYAMLFLQIAANLNLSFAILNIIPVYPFDGSKILNLFLNPNTSIQITQYEKIMQMVLLFLIFGGYIGSILNPICNAILGIF